MDTMTAGFMQSDKQLQQLLKYGASGGKENRGILTQIKAAELPDEPVNVFSNAPAEFEERSRILWDDTQKLYYHACKANRFSENYLKYSQELEKSIRQMGSICITKAALEQKGLEFKSLEELGVEELVRMVSYHLRKAHAALEGIYKDNNLLGMSYLKQEFRWDALISRLQATEVKILKIRDGKLDAEDLLERDENFRGAPRTNDGFKTGMSPNLLPNDRALPINGSMAREMLRKEKVLAKQQKEYERLERKLQNSALAGGKIIKPYPVPKVAFYEDDDPKAPARHDITQLPPGTITEAEARKKLMDEAMKRGDQKAVMEIPLEDSKTFQQRWLRRNEEARKELRNLRLDGPSEEKRKSLREKRKKRK
ncbi:MAG: hypothetical protein II969_07900 [Anaerolineaceae bacterium]|nr:hypothetical protein [Anaerolineaceae bacterium]